MTQNMVQDAAVTSKAALLSPPLFYLSLQEVAGKRLLVLGRWSYFPNSQGCDTGASLGPVCGLWIRKTTRRVTARRGTGGRVRERQKRD